MLKFRGCITSVFFYDQVQCSVVRTDFLWASVLPVWPGSGSGPSPNKHKAPGRPWFLLNRKTMKNWVVATQRWVICMVNVW